MTATAQMLERSGGVREGKFTINDRVNIVFFDGRQRVSARDVLSRNDTA